MQGRSWVVLAVGVAVLMAVIVGAVATGGRAQPMPEPATIFQAAAVASQPAQGGKVYLYVVDGTREILSVFEDGVLAASYQLRVRAGDSHRYTLTAERSEPVDGGQTYCFAIDQHDGTVHAFRGTERLGSETLPDAGQQP
jgi:hypothetical protein